MLLEAGDIVPADMRIVETNDLTVDEAALTGKSVPVVKDADAPLAEDVTLGDQITMAYRGTLVTCGRDAGLGHRHLQRQTGTLTENRKRAERFILANGETRSSPPPA
ncbi:MAG: ATPase, partial [Alphaproteobacteria bacterium]|nr:ATPase [Alphaproteobacteria bacterium]